MELSLFGAKCIKKTCCKNSRLYRKVGAEGRT
jgi:hypothetical protein